MISTRLVYKKKVFEHRCCTCGFTWQDDTDQIPVGGCPICSAELLGQENTLLKVQAPGRTVENPYYSGDTRGPNDTKN